MTQEAFLQSSLTINYGLFRKPGITSKTESNIRTWIEALRSGNYSQCSRSLRKGRHFYCCLGVAQEILQLDEISNCNLTSSHATVGLQDGYGSFLKVEIDKGTISSLTGLNDVSRWPFASIATFIENQLNLVTSHEN